MSEMVLMDKVRVATIKDFKIKHPISFDCIKKQGALEELEGLLLEFLNKDKCTFEDWNYNIMFIKKRIKELEEEKTISQPNKTCNQVLNK